MQEHISRLKNGENVWLPKYDMSGTAIRKDKGVYASPSDIIISEGLFTMCVKDVFDICIYVDIDKETQKKRWYERAIERNLGDAMDSMYENANNKANIYIRPFMTVCDVIISGVGPRPKYKELMHKILSKLKESHICPCLT
jgi:uridine kinase